MKNENRMKINGKVYVSKKPLGTFTTFLGNVCSECRGCAFNTDEMLETCDSVICCADGRKDGRDVIWVEEIGQTSP